jgi:prepilin-type N-terminal cleavage/methylation domain-containing protein
MHMSLRAKQTGFTFIELIITTLIISVISLAITKLVSQIFNSYIVGNNINQLDTQALAGIERIVNDLRLSSALTAITATSLTYVNQSGTSYTYQLSGSNLQRGSYTLIDSVSSVAFTYMDANGSVTATPALVDYVKIALTLTSSNTPVSLSTTIAMRGSS